MHGIENVCCMTGDDVAAGDEPETRRVFDLDSPQLIAARRGHDATGRYLSGRADRARAAPLPRRGREPGRAAVRAPRRARARKKADAGARFLQLQLCFAPDRLEAFMAGAAATGLRRALRADPVDPASCARARALQFVDDKVAGHRRAAPRSIARVEAAADQQTECFDIACELADHALVAAGRRGPALHLVPQGRRHRQALHTTGHPAQSRKGAAWTQSFSRGLSTVTIGREQPFCIIGERINPTGRKVFAEELRGGDLSTVDRRRARPRSQAGADMLDVNAGIPLVDEAELLRSMLRAVQDAVDLPICIDSSVIEALEAGLAVYEGKALVNSVTGEDERLEEILPLVARHGAAVIGLANDETGIPETPAAAPRDRDARSSAPPATTGSRPRTS